MNKNILNHNVKALLVSNSSITDEDERIFSCIMSYELVDREGDVVLVDGINLSQFKTQSPLLYNHDDDKPIGKVLEVTKGDGYLRAKCKIAKNVERCDETWELIKQGVITAVSIGFIPTEMRRPTPVDIAKFGDDVDTVISKCTLVELSVVSVPANYMAVIDKISQKHFKKEFKEVNVVNLDNEPSEEEIEKEKEKKEIKESNVMFNVNEGKPTELAKESLANFEEIEQANKEVIEQIQKEIKPKKIKKTLTLDLDDIMQKQIRNEIKNKIRKEMGFIN